ncbi:MAG: hypothetical protein WAU74_15520 [Pseudolabrys sp.]|jgi:hypothetical protein
MRRSRITAFFGKIILAANKTKKAWVEPWPDRPEGLAALGLVPLAAAALDLEQSQY